MIEFETYPKEEVWTSFVPDVIATTDTTGKIVFTIYCGGFPDGDVVFKNTMYAVGGKIVVTDLGEVLSTYMRSKTLRVASFTLKASEGSESGVSALASFTACYCTRAMKLSVRAWASAFFLSTFQTGTISPKESLRLTALCGKDETSCSITAVGRTGTGAIVQCTFPMAVTPQNVDGLQAVELPLISTQAVHVQASTLSKLHSLLSFTVNFGARSIQMFVVDRPANSVTFRFANMFNVEERLTLRGVVKKTLELTRGEAIVNQSSRAYDISGYRSYELTTVPMPEADAARVEQLVASWRVADAAGRNLFFTSTDFSYDTDNSTLKTLTLQWRYAYRKIVDETETPATSTIFTDPFTYQFS